jgi:hypothetical protein
MAKLPPHLDGPTIVWCIEMLCPYCAGIFREDGKPTESTLPRGRHLVSPRRLGGS